MDRHCPLTPDEHTPSHLRLGLALLEADRPEEARAALQGMSAYDTTADPTADPLHHWALAYSSWLVGRWDRATLEVRAGLATAEASRGPASGAAVAGVGVVVALHRDDLAGARDLLVQIQGQLVAQTRPCPLWSLGTEALVLDVEGRPDMAFEVLAEGWDRAGPVHHLWASRLFGPELVRLAVAGGCPKRAAAVADEIGAFAGRRSDPGAHAAALRCRGLLGDDPEILLRAVTILRQAGRPLELGLASEEAATALMRAGRPGPTGPLLGQALGAYQSLGATRDIIRIAEILRSGDNPAVGPSGTEPPVAAGRAGGRSKRELTTRELEILDLLVAGVGTRAMAERLFVSNNTVRNHIQNILRKLEAHTRLQAVSVAVREGILQPPRLAEPSAEESTRARGTDAANTSYLT